MKIINTVRNCCHNFVSHWSTIGKKMSEMLEIVSDCKHTCPINPHALTVRSTKHWKSWFSVQIKSEYTVCIVFAFDSRCKSLNHIHFIYFYLIQILSIYFIYITSYSTNFIHTIYITSYSINLNYSINTSSKHFFYFI